MSIYARDDPFVSTSVYDAHDWSRNDALLPAIVNVGGHVSFVGADNEGLWHNRCVLHAAEHLDMP